MQNYHIAEINIAKMKGVDINDPIMKEFVENLDSVNQIAEQSSSFVCRSFNLIIDVKAPFN